MWKLNMAAQSVRCFAPTTASTSTKMKVVLTKKIPQRALLRLTENKDIDLIHWSDELPIPRNYFLEQVKGAHGILCMLTDRIDDELLEHAGPSLKIVSTMSVGFDHIDVQACKKRNVLIGNTPGVLTDATADLTMALLLATSRLLPQGMNAVKVGEWGPWDPNWLCGVQITGKTMGIVGLGRIGFAVGQRLRAFSIGRLLYTGTKPKPEAEKIQGEFVDFDKLLRESDVVIACASLNEKTKHLFNKEAFSKMKKTAIFINTSRGGLVDQVALHDCLKDNQIYAAGLDVTTPEPLPLTSPLLNLSNCLILPHVGSATIETREKMAMLAVDNLFAGLSSRKIPHSVL